MNKVCFKSIYFLFLTLVSLNFFSSVSIAKKDAEILGKVRDVISQLKEFPQDVNVTALNRQNADRAAVLFEDSIELMSELSSSDEVNDSKRVGALVELANALGEFIVNFAEPFDDIVSSVKTISDLENEGVKRGFVTLTFLGRHIAHVITAIFVRDIPSMVQSSPVPWIDLRDDSRSWALKRMANALVNLVRTNAQNLAQNSEDESTRLLLSALYRVIHISQDSEPVRWGWVHKLVRTSYFLVGIWHVVMGPIIEPVITRDRLSPAWGVLFGTVLSAYFVWLRTVNSGLPFFDRVFTRSLLHPFTPSAVSHLNRSEVFEGAPNCQRILAGLDLRRTKTRLLDWLRSKSTKYIIRSRFGR